MALGIVTVETSMLAGSLLAIVMGVMVLAFPTLLRYLVGAYLLFVGVLGILTRL